MSAKFTPYGRYMLRAKHAQSGREDYAFECPGCRCYHAFSCGGGDGPRWTHNGDAAKPTFAPSLMVNRDDPATRCHLFLRDGVIQFLNDCHHKLAGVNAPLLPIEGDQA